MKGKYIFKKTTTFYIKNILRSNVYFALNHCCSTLLLTLNALRSDDVGGLMCGILHPRTGDAQLLHDAVQQPLDVGLGNLVSGAGAPGWSRVELRAQQQAEQR